MKGLWNFILFQICIIIIIIYLFYLFFIYLFNQKGLIKIQYLLCREYIFIIVVVVIMIIIIYLFIFELDNLVCQII